MEKYNYSELLDYINPSGLEYQDWLNVGMALKYEGCPLEAWETWSSRDSKRFHPKECAIKWEGFRGSDNPVTGKTIYQMAVSNGWTPSLAKGHELKWDDVIEKDDKYVVVDKNWLEGKAVLPPKRWDPVEELVLYLETLFEAGEYVGYLMQSREDDRGRFKPAGAGNYDLTADELIRRLNDCKGDIGSIMGDYNPAAGAWIRFNPLDGKGVKTENVTDFRYALIESDDMDIEEQNAMLRDMQIPIALLLFSGNKSIHAIVKINAHDYDEYKSRVEYLYKVCKKNGMSIDTQNRNPSRMTRMPGVFRGDNRQYIIDTHIGKKDWEEWRDYIESVNDDLPDMDNLASVWDNMPPLAPPLIEDILREGHKMLLAGPSKAGKSFLLIELAIAIAEGREWLGWKCSQGNVIYVNLELDSASCFHRFQDVYNALKWEAKNINNITIWNLRGLSQPLNHLAPKLIRRAQKKGCKAIIVDPIYKIITGDENSASEMSQFCNQFDKICTELKCATIYCHHHSKGAQGQKNATDRAAGSGVFARDPDALLDMIELVQTEDFLKQKRNLATCSVIEKYLKSTPDIAWNWKDDISLDDWMNSKNLQSYCENNLTNEQYKSLHEQIESEMKIVNSSSAWRVESTLREFPAAEPVNVWFKYPTHSLDRTGMLQDLEAESKKTLFEKMKQKRAETTKKNKEQRINNFIVAFEGLVDEDGKVKLSELAEQIGHEQRVVGLWLGKGKQANEELKKMFETFDYDIGNGAYIRCVRRIQKQKQEQKQEQND